MSLFEHSDNPLDLTKKIRRLGGHCCALGAFGDIYKCSYDSPSGTLEVAVKALRFSIMPEENADMSQQGKLLKHLRRELGIWKRLDHQHIVPFLGIATGFGPYTSLVSMWMPNGTLQAFLKIRGDQLSIIDRFRLLQNIISGLEYLHDCHVVHGDLTPTNILIDGNFQARLTDFGFSSAIGNLPPYLAYLQMSSHRTGTIQWAAPEKVLQESDRATDLTTKSDIYSFGCIMLQVLSGKQPWLGVREFMIPVYMHKGTNPPRPLSHPIDDQHWTLIEECFLPVDERPSTGHVVAHINNMLALISRWHVGLPDNPLDLTMGIRRLDAYPCDGGACGDIYKCLYDSPSGTLEVAVKAFRFSIIPEEDADVSQQGKLLKHLRQELGIWTRLDHQHIVPFLGIASGFGPYTSLVSMWMPNGTLQAFLKIRDDQLFMIDRFRLLQNIISGLEYLHDCRVVHGDLTPTDILIDGNFQARLGGFGFSSVIGNLPAGLAYLRSSSARPGAIRWAAPELIVRESDRATDLTTKSDIYSFGCIMLQVLSGKQPWSGINGGMILVHIDKGTKPPRPSFRPIDDQHWALIEKCFLPVDTRPSTEHVAARIASILASLSPLVDSPPSAISGQDDISSEQGLRLEDSTTNDSSTQDAASSKQPVDSIDHEKRNKKSKFKFKWLRIFSTASK